MYNRSLAAGNVAASKDTLARRHAIWMLTCDDVAVCIHFNTYRSAHYSRGRAAANGKNHLVSVNFNFTTFGIFEGNTARR